MSTMPSWASPLPPMGDSVRVSSLGTVDDTPKSAFYYDSSGSLRQTKDSTEYNANTGGMFNMIGLDYQFFPTDPTHQTFLADPGKSNNRMEIWKPAIRQAFAYEGVKEDDAAGIAALEAYFNVVRAPEYDNMGTAASATLGKLGQTFPDISGAATDVKASAQGLAAALGIGNIQAGTAEETDIALAAKAYAKNGVTPPTYPVDAMFTNETREARIKRERQRNDPDFNPTKAWSNLTQNQQDLLTQEGWSAETWKQSDSDKARNSIDYFVGTEEYIRKRVYDNALTNNFNQSWGLGYYGSYFVSGVANSLFDNLDNLTLTAVTLPAGGWGAGAEKAIVASTSGIVAKTLAALKLGPASSVNALAKTVLFEGALTNAGLMVGASASGNVLDYSQSGLVSDDLVGSSIYTNGAIEGALTGAAAVFGMHYIPRLLKGSLTKGYDALPESFHAVIEGATGDTISNGRYMRAMRKAFEDAGVDADQFYLFPGLNPAQAGVLMHNEQIGISMMQKIVTDNGWELSKFKRFLSRDHLNTHGVELVDVANALVEHIRDLGATKPSADNVAGYLDEFLRVSKTEIGDMTLDQFRIARAEQVLGMSKSGLDDIRYNTSKPLKEADRTKIGNLRTEIAEMAPKADESANEFGLRKFKSEMDLAILLARSDSAKELAEATKMLQAYRAEMGQHFPPTGDKILSHLKKTIDDVEGKSTTERKIIRLERIRKESKRRRGIKFKTSDELKIDTTDPVETIIDRLATYRKERRKAVPKLPEVESAVKDKAITGREGNQRYKEVASSHTASLEDQYKGDLALLDKLYESEIFTDVGRVPDGDLLTKLKAADPNAVDTDVVNYLEAVKGMKKAFRDREKAFRKAADAPTNADAITIRDNAHTAFLKASTKFLDTYGGGMAEQEALYAASLRQQVVGFKNLTLKEKDLIAENLFHRITLMGDKFGSEMNVAYTIAKGEGSPFSKLTEAISNFATWPQTQKNSFLSDLRAIRGLAVLHDETLSFANSFRNIGNPTSLRAATMGAIADAMLPISVGNGIRTKFGADIKAEMSRHIISSRLRRAVINEESLPKALVDKLKAGNYSPSEAVTSMNRWNQATTMYYSNMLESGKQAGILPNGFDPQWFVPHRLPSDLSAVAFEDAIKTMTALRNSQWTAKTPLEKTLLEAIGLVHLTNEGDILIPEDSIFAHLDADVSKRAAKLKNLMNGGLEGFERWLNETRLANGIKDSDIVRSPVKAGTMDKSYASPKFTKTDAKVVADLLSTTDRDSPEYAQLYDQIQGIEDEKTRAAAIKQWGTGLIAQHGNGTGWIRGEYSDAVMTEDGFAGLSPVHEHVQRLWQDYGVRDPEQQKICRRALVNVPEAVLRVRTEAPKGFEGWGADLESRTILNQRNVPTKASVFLHEVGHFVLYDNPTIFKAASHIINNLSMLDQFRLRLSMGSNAGNALYGLDNVDEVGAVFFETWMKSGRRHPPAGGVLGKLFRYLKDVASFRDDMQPLARSLTQVFEKMDDASLNEFTLKVADHKAQALNRKSTKARGEKSTLQKYLEEVVIGYSDRPVPLTGKSLLAMVNNSALPERSKLRSLSNVAELICDTIDEIQKNASTPITDMHQLRTNILSRVGNLDPNVEPFMAKFMMDDTLDIGHLYFLGGVDGMAFHTDHMALMSATMFSSQRTLPADTAAKDIFSGEVWNEIINKAVAVAKVGRSTSLKQNAEDAVQKTYLSLFSKPDKWKRYTPEGLIDVDETRKALEGMLNTIAPKKVVDSLNKGGKNAKLAMADVGRQALERQSFKETGVDFSVISDRLFKASEVELPEPLKNLPWGEDNGKKWILNERFAISGVSDDEVKAALKGMGKMTEYRLRDKLIHEFDTKLIAARFNEDVANSYDSANLTESIVNAVDALSNQPEASFGEPPVKAAVPSTVETPVTESLETQALIESIPQGTQTVKRAIRKKSPDIAADVVAAAEAIVEKNQKVVDAQPVDLENMVLPWGKNSLKFKDPIDKAVYVASLYQRTPNNPKFMEAMKVVGSVEEFNKRIPEIQRKIYHANKDVEGESTLLIGEGNAGIPPKDPPAAPGLPGDWDPVFFVKRVEHFKARMKEFTERQAWKRSGPSVNVDALKEDWVGKLNRGRLSSAEYVDNFTNKYGKTRTALEVAMKGYADNMTGRSTGFVTGDTEDTRTAVARLSQSDSLQKGERVFADADFTTPEGEKLASMFADVNDLDRLVLNYARSTGTRINAQLVLDNMLRDTQIGGNIAKGTGFTWDDLYNQVEAHLKSVLALSQNGKADHESMVIVSKLVDQFREKYLRAIGKFPSDDADTTFNTATKIAKALVLNILGPVAAPTIGAVEVPMSFIRSISLAPKRMARNFGDILADVFERKPGESHARFQENMEDLVFWSEEHDSSPIGKLTGESSLVGDGESTIPITFMDRLKSNWAATLRDAKNKNFTKGMRASKAVLGGLTTTAQAGADIAGLRYFTKFAKRMGAKLARGEMIDYVPGLMKVREALDYFHLESLKDDAARLAYGKEVARKTGVPLYVINRAHRTGMLQPGRLEAMMELFPEVTWGKGGSRTHMLDLNKAREVMYQLDQTENLMTLTPNQRGSQGIRREALTGLHRYIEESVTLASPELRGIFRLDRSDQLNPWKRLMFFWQGYPMAFHNMGIQAAFRNQTVGMALGNIFGLFIFELQARMTRDVILADNEEKRKKAIDRWQRFYSLDPMNLSSELLQGSALVPAFGAVQWIPEAIMGNLFTPSLPKDEQRSFFSKTIGSSPVTSVANRTLKTFALDPLKSLGKSIAGQDPKWDRTLNNVLTYIKDSTPGVNSWGTTGYNLIQATSVADHVRSPFNSMPDGMKSWITLWNQEHINPEARKRPASRSQPFQVPEGAPKVGSPLDALTELRKPRKSGL